MKTSFVFLECDLEAYFSKYNVKHIHFKTAFIINGEVKNVTPMNTVGLLYSLSKTCEYLPKRFLKIILVEPL